MNFNNNRIQDVSKVFDRNWNVNHDRQGRQAVIDDRKKHFDKMYNIRSKEDKREEILRANSVEGQIGNLNSRMQAVVGNQNRMRINDFKNNFK